MSNQNAGMSETQQEYLFHTNAVILHKTSQQAHPRLVNTLGLPLLLYKNGLLPDIHVTSLLHFNKKKNDLREHLKHATFCHTSVNTTHSRDYSLNAPEKLNHLKTKNFSSPMSLTLFLLSA